MFYRCGWGVVRTWSLLLVTVIQIAGPPRAHAEAGKSQGEKEPSTEAPLLTLSWLDPHRLFPDGWKSVRRQTLAIFSEIGVSIDWRTAEEGKTFRADVFSLQVLLVKSEPSTWGLSPGAMGAVLSQAAPQRTAYIFFPAVLRALGYKSAVLMNRPLRQREEWEIARALSRVLSHEVVHAMVPSMPHAGAGLTRSQLDRDYLLHPNGLIHPDAAEAFRRELIRLSPHTAETAAATPSLQK